MSNAPLELMGVPDVTDERRRAFDRDGVVRVPDVLTADALKGIRDAVDRAAQHRREVGRPVDGFWVESHRYEVDAQLRGWLAASPALVAAVASVLGCESLWVLEETFLVKEPGASRPTPWHQDQVYYPLAGRQVATAWVALDAVDAAAGGLQYAPGSHRAGLRFEPVNFGDGRRFAAAGLAPLPGGRPAVDGPSPIGFATRPGDAIIHHGLTLHAAGGNLTANRRRAWALSFFGDDVSSATTAFPWTHPRAAGLAGGRAPRDVFTRVLANGQPAGVRGHT